MMEELISHEGKTVLMTIQNSRNPNQVIRLILNRAHGDHLETEGLGEYFGLKEIRVETEDVLHSLQEYAAVLSFLLETMSTARDLNLPYYYQNEFEFQGARYTLPDEGSHRSLKRIEEIRH